MTTETKRELSRTVELRTPTDAELLAERDRRMGLAPMEYYTVPEPLLDLNAAGMALARAQQRAALGCALMLYLGPEASGEWDVLPYYINHSQRGQMATLH